MFKLDPKAMLLASMTLKSESKTWGGHNRSMTTGGSEVGQCQRKVVYDKHDVTQTPVLSKTWVRQSVVIQWKTGLLPI